jgi:hypothetical protein
MRQGLRNLRLMQSFMNAKCLLFAVFLLALTGCSTTRPGGGRDRIGSETVLITYHVKSGKEAEFQALLSHAWEIYRSEQMVFYRPHTVVRTVEDGDKTRFVEVFTWVKTPDHAPDNVKAIWQQEHSLCEARNGRPEIEGGQVQLIIGK